MTSDTFRVLIVEPDEYRRQRHCLELLREGGFEVAAACARKREAMMFLALITVDFVDTNSVLPVGNPADIIRATVKKNPDALVLAASSCDDANIVMHTVTAGANGYILFSDTTSGLPACLRVMHSGGSPVSPAIARTVLRSLQSREGMRRTAPESCPLSPRELDVMRLIAKGISFTEISQILALSEYTVSTHAKKIYRKLEVHSRGEAVYEARHMNLID